MSDTTESVVTPESVETPSTETPKQSSRAEMRAKLAADRDAAVESIFAKKPLVSPETSIPATEPAPVATNPETAQEAVAALEEAGAEVPAQKPNETKVQYETKIAKLLLQVQRAEANGLKYKSDLEKTTSELSELKAKFAEASSDPVKALKLANMTPDELAQAMLDGKLSRAEEKVAKQELAPEVLEIIAEHKRLKAEKAEREAATKAEAERGELIKTVGDLKKTVLDRFPVLELIPDGSVLDAYLQVERASNNTVSFEEFAASMQKNVISELSAGMSHKGTLKAILAEKPELREFLIAELGLKASAPALVPKEPESPRVLTNAVGAENPSKGRELSARERMQLAAAAANKMFER
jgi:hypothetical protein